MDGSPLQQDLLREAADGLKHIAQAVEGKSIGAMVADLSAFGRQNPLAYLGGRGSRGLRPGALRTSFRTGERGRPRRFEMVRQPDAPTARTDRSRTPRPRRELVRILAEGRAMPEDRSTPALMGDLIESVSQLVRKEIQLFRAEMGEKATKATVAAGSILVAAVLAITALNVFAAAVVAALTKAGISATWSAVIVGGVLAIIAFLMASRGINNLKAGSLAPERTVRAATRDASMVKEKI